MKQNLFWEPQVISHDEKEAAQKIYKVIIIPNIYRALNMCQALSKHSAYINTLNP